MICAAVFYVIWRQSIPNEEQLISFLRWKACFGGSYPFIARKPVEAWQPALLSAKIATFMLPMGKLGLTIIPHRASMADRLIQRQQTNPPSTRQGQMYMRAETV